MLKILHSFEDRQVTLYPDGILDISTVDVFDNYIEGLFESLGHFTHITVDFTRISFIDSTGIGAVLRAIYKCLENGCTFGIVGLSEYLQDIFETMGVPRVIDSLLRGAL